MSIVSTQSLIHNRSKKFVKWVAPESETRDAIQKQADEIQSRIKPKAEADGLIVISSIISGSHAKESGLRRYLRGNSVEEGQDIDITFILALKDKNGNENGCLVDKFKQYAEESYPDSEVGTTKSSAYIKFAGTKLKYDLVPLFETNRTNIQLLKRTDGEHRTTSVQKHTDFIRDRKKTSEAIDGVVKFNECLRLIKWWRTEQQEHSGVFGNGDGEKKVPSFLVDLLCAYAYDNRSVDKTYPSTLAMWFGLLANLVRNRKDVIFTTSTNGSAASNGVLWRVLDPVDNSNNIVANWSNAQINELARWFEDARDELNRAIRYDEQGEDNASMDCLVKIFGSAFKNNCQ